MGKSVLRILFKRLLILVSIMNLAFYISLAITWQKYGLLPIWIRVIAYVLMLLHIFVVVSILKKNKLFRQFIAFIFSVLSIVIAAIIVLTTLKGVKFWDGIYKVGEKEEVVARPIDTNEKSINIYIAGVDNAGSISDNSRCDVNIIMTINPKTKKILLTSTPRDSYVAIGGDHNKLDKLTHAGNYGVAASMKALEDLYGLNIDYFIKVNFRTFKGLVDSLGGVEINIEKDFVSNGSNIEFKKGINKLNGEQALGFVRERYAFTGGDLARAKHQQEVLKAIFNKLLSASSMKNIDKVTGSLSGNMSSNLPLKSMTGLMNSTLNNFSKSWDMQSQSVYGRGRNDLPSYAMPGYRLYIMQLDDGVVTEAKKKMVEIMDER